MRRKRNRISSFCYTHAEMAEQPGNSGICAVVRQMSLFLSCVLIFECLLIAIAPQFHSGSVLKIAKDSLLFRMRTDSWAYMVQGDLAWHQHPDRIYETTFFNHNVRFIYPPTSLFLYRAWQSARTVGIHPFTALKATLFLAFIGTWIVSCQFFFSLLPRGMMDDSSFTQRWCLRIVLAVLICTFLPLINALFLGQVQTLLNFFLIFSAFLWLKGYRKAPGILIGLACWLKPPMALFVIWGLLRRQWSFIVSLASMLVLGVALSLAIFGVHNTTEYLAVLDYLGRHGDALFTNQSLNGLLHRVMHVGSPVTWVHGYPPFSRAIYFATLASSAMYLLAAVLVPGIRRINGTITDFLIFAMADIMASPIAWEHHYGVFFLVFLLWLPDTLRWSRFLGLLGIYLLMTDTWAPITALMYTRWTFLISHVYIGGLLLFAWTLFHRDAVLVGVKAAPHVPDRPVVAELQSAKAAQADA